MEQPHSPFEDSPDGRKTHLENIRGKLENAREQGIALRKSLAEARKNGASADVDDLLQAIIDNDTEEMRLEDEMGFFETEKGE